MQSVGRIIRAARLEAGLSLEDIVARTRIAIRNLEAIEEDNPSTIASPFFYKSFVKQIANELNLDLNLISPLVESVVAEMPQPLVPGQNERAVTGIVIRSAERKRSYKWLYSIASLVIVLVGCSGLYAVWENAKNDLTHVLTNLKSKVVRSTSSDRAAEPLQGTPSGDAPSQPGNVQPGVPLAEPTDGFHVELAALEPTWLSIIADGRRTFSGTLEAEQKKVFDGHEQGRIRTGNAGGISFTFNGKQIGVLGARGQVRTIVFTKDGYEILQPEVGVAALTSFSPTFGWKSLHALKR